MSPRVRESALGGAGSREQGDSSGDGREPRLDGRAHTHTQTERREQERERERERERENREREQRERWAACEVL